MTSLRTHLDKIRSDAAECMLLSKLAPDGKGEMFAKTAEHLNALAFELEKTIAKSNADSGVERSEGANVVPTGDPEEAVAANIGAAHHQKATRPHRIFTWLFVIIFGGVVGFFWSSEPAKRYWSYALQSKHEMSQASEDKPAEAIAGLLSAEHAERKILMEQVSALTARVDNLKTILDNLKTANAEIAGQSNKVSIGSEEKQKLPVTEEKSSAAEGNSPKEEKLTSTSESLSATKRSSGVLAEPADRVGTVPVAPRRAELDPRKSAVGPLGCTQFRSFDPMSGTYMTLDGRRRPCKQ